MLTSPGAVYKLTNQVLLQHQIVASYKTSAKFSSNPRISFSRKSTWKNMVPPMKSGQNKAILTCRYIVKQPPKN